MQPTDLILNPTVFLGSFEWREPITTLTDFLVAIIAFIGFLKFSFYKGEKSVSFSFYKYYFLCFAIGMTSAAWFGHGLQAYVGPEFKRIGWTCSATGLLILAFASLLQIQSEISKKFFQVVRILIISQYILFLFLMLSPQYSDFIYAQLSTTVALVGIVLPMQIFYYRKSRKVGSLIISIAIVYGIVPGAVYNNQISFHRWFNYHDFSHVLVAVFMTTMIIGASRLSMLTKSPKS